MPTIAAPAKVLLRFLDRIDLPLLVPEQFEIADHDYVVDIEHTMNALDWKPKFGDQEMMNDAESPGRKLEFLTQEMFREANTIGSKAGDVEISREVVEIKATLEKIRELVQNVE